VQHARRAHNAMPGSRLEIFDGVGHFPFHTDPARFITLLEEFLAETTPSPWNGRQWRQLLRRGGDPTPPRLRTIGERSAT
jgi:hypothetical protein